MSRLAAAVHLGWMAVVVLVALGAGWMFRFEGERGLYYLDRWTGEVVDGVANRVHYRYSLRRPVQREASVRTVTEDPEGVVQRTGAFDDLVPPERRAR